jgi:hypothetical protein
LTELSGVELPDERFSLKQISIAEGSVLGTLSFSRAVERLRNRHGGYFQEET